MIYIIYYIMCIVWFVNFKIERDFCPIFINKFFEKQRDISLLSNSTDDLTYYINHISNNGELLNIYGPNISEFTDNIVSSSDDSFEFEISFKLKDRDCDTNNQNKIITYYCNILNNILLNIRLSYGASIITNVDVEINNYITDNIIKFNLINNSIRDYSRISHLIYDNAVNANVKNYIKNALILEFNKNNDSIENNKKYYLDNWQKVFNEASDKYPGIDEVENFIKTDIIHEFHNMV